MPLPSPARSTSSSEASRTARRFTRALPRGSVIARFGVGHEWIDKGKASAAGLLCTNTPSVLDQSVAELTFLLVSAAARRLTSIAGAMRDGEWTPLLGVELKGKTLTIVGAGRIGQAVARIAKRGFEMRVVGCRRKGSSAPMPASGDFDLVTDDLAEALGQADFVSLLIPGVPANAHFINRDRIELMSRHAWLINTARGAVVDEAALYDALVAQRLGGAALDVFDREPYQPVDPSRDLRTLPERHPHAPRREHDARSQPRHGRARRSEHRLGRREGLREHGSSQPGRSDEGHVTVSMSAS